MADEKTTDKAAADKAKDAKAPVQSAEDAASAEGAIDPNTSKLGKFILKYHTFLRSEEHTSELQSQ